MERPPLNGDVILRARLGKFLTQAEVQQECKVRGVDISASSLSRIESGAVERPALRVIPVLAEVLGLDVNEMFKRGDEVAA